MSSKTAPDFTLLNQRGESISLGSFRGKKNVVLYFYPRAMTPHCTAQACHLRDVRSEFERLDTVVLGVSPDPLKSLEKFYTKKRLNFDLLSDPGHEVAKKYGVFKRFHGVRQRLHECCKKILGRLYFTIRRETFIIGMDGEIKNHISGFEIKDHHQDVLAWIKNHSP